MRLDIYKICVGMLLIAISNSISAQTVNTEDDDFIKASILITSIGESPYQITGHAAFRLECDSLGLDRVFSFENNAGNNLKKLYWEGAIGRVLEYKYDDYTQEFIKEGREVKALDLNLTFDEKLRLWEVLDSVKLLPPKPFNILDSHCFSQTIDILSESLSPNIINVNEVGLEWENYSEIASISGGDANPWNYLLIMLALGNAADQQGEGRAFIFPTTALMVYDKFRVMTPEGRWKPLFNGTPKVILPLTRQDKANHPTPLELSLSILGIVLIITAFQFFGKLKLAAKILDSFLWIGVTLGGVFITLITYMPYHYGGNWNWPLLVLNPIAWLPVVLLRRNREAMMVVWGVYSFVLIAFAALIGFVAPSIDIFWKLLAVALAIRCLWHLYSELRHT